MTLSSLISQVTLGQHNKIAVNENIEVRVAKLIFAHPFFLGQLTGLKNDIGVLVIDKVSFSDSVRPICVQKDFQNRFVNQYATGNHAFLGMKFLESDEFGENYFRMIIRNKTNRNSIVFLRLFSLHYFK